MKFLACLLSLMLSACTTACVSPWEPSALYHRITPPDTYHALWDETARCVSLTVPLDGIGFDQVKWYIVDNATWVWTSQGWAVGVSTKSRRIYIPEAYKDHPMVIAHEEAHQMTGIFADDPVDPFIRCHLTWASWP